MLPSCLYFLQGLSACECFGREHREVLPVSEAARGLVPDAPPSTYNIFAPPPILLFEGPYVCDADSHITSGQFQGLDEDRRV